MSVVSWIIPRSDIAAAPTSPGSGFSFVPGSSLSSLDASPGAGLAGLFDQLIDPNTGDYLRTENGEWAETADTRTAMQLMIDIELGASPYDPADGTLIAEARRSGAPLTPDDIRAETLRAGGVLQAAGLISDLVVQVRDQSGQVLRDQSGRLVVQLSWRDLASGSPVDLALQTG